MRNIALVALGGALGSVARYLITAAMAGVSVKFPFGTALINILGSFIIGVMYGLSRSGSSSEAAALFWMAGVCGGFTTFSAFSLQTLQLFQQNQPGLAFLNVLFSCALCIAATWGGLMLTK